jgi:hypothetical protein
MLSFERCNRRAYSGLAESKTLRCAGEMLYVGNRDKYA